MKRAFRKRRGRKKEKPSLRSGKEREKNGERRRE